GAQVVATVDGTNLTKAEWAAYRDYLAAYEQQYMQMYYGFSMPLDEEAMASYGETALQQMIQSTVLQNKMVELGIEPLSEEKAAEVDEYAQGMFDLYKMMARVQAYPDVETVEEEQERLAGEAEPGEPVATMTDAELDELLIAEVEAMGYTMEYFVQNQKASVQNDLLYAQVTEGVEVTDEQVKAEFNSEVAAQKESYDATPTLYASNSDSAYYVPAGYRGVKNLLIKVTDEAQAKIDEASSALTTAQNAAQSANAQLEELKAMDTAEYDEATLAAHNEQIAALETEAASAQTSIDENTAALAAAEEAAFAEILPKAEEVLAKVKAGEDFDALMAEYGEDGGMKSEPAMTEGYRICEGLTLYVPEFQDAAMALANVGDTSELVKTSYGYHILQYATDIAAGEVEFTEEIKTAIYNEMLTAAKDAAYNTTVEQWVAAADVKTFDKVMK
ncbi:MAG: peptidylprolyl isomerase, partial [Clostridia bacterium]|nr:peptidylprolyl isomerase [Clostridia bacterium]